jgi:hypothetical protein
MSARIWKAHRWLGSLVPLVLLADAAVAQAPAQPPGGPQGQTCHRRGPIHRMFHHVEHSLEENFIGQPSNFVEPPVGYYVNEQFAVQVAKADPHRFTVYRSDFIAGTDQFSPVGASRFNIMYRKLPAWPGPVTVEWTPDQPGLANARRQAILATLERAGQPLPPERVVIGPSPYPGASAIEAANNYNNLLGRSQNAAQGFALPPAESASSGVR